MRKELKDYMKLGIVHFMAYPDESKRKETIKKVLCDEYFDVIEVTGILPEETKKDLLSSRITVCYGAQPVIMGLGLNVNSVDEDKRKESVEVLKNYIDEAYSINAVGFGFLSGHYEEENKELAFQQLLVSSYELCEYAKLKGTMKIFHEVFDFDVDKCSLIGPSSLAAEYAEIVTSKYDNFGLMLDLSHIPLVRESIKDCVQTLRKYIGHIHIGNAVVADKSMDAYGDLHPRFGFPNSENDVEELIEFLDSLFQIGYFNEEEKRIVSFEVKPFKDEDPDIIMSNNKRTLNQAWAVLQKKGV